MSEEEFRNFKETLKPIFRGYKKINASMEQKLKALGFKIIRQKNHYIMTYSAGGKDFEFAIQKTPGDCRSGIKTVKDITKVIRASGIVKSGENADADK